MITALPVCYLVVQWNRNNSTFAMAPYEQIQAPLTPDSPAPISAAETAVLEWLRRIHFKARTGFRKTYPSLVSEYPEGDVFGYLMTSSIEGMERALQETAFNEYSGLRRLYVVFIAPNDRESTAALRTMPTRTFPARTSIVIGHIDKRSGAMTFVPDEEHPDQKTWR